MAIVAKAKLTSMSNRYLYLKNADGDIVKQEQFGCTAKKQKIIDKWRKLYGKKFEDLTVQEDPPELKEKYKPKANNNFYGSMNLNRKRNITNIRKDWGYKD